MTSIKPGEKCFLDGKQEVTVVKPFNKLSTKYVVETPDSSVVLMETQRLTPVTVGTVPALPSPSIV